MFKPLREDPHGCRKVVPLVPNHNESESGSTYDISVSLTFSFYHYDLERGLKTESGRSPLQDRSLKTISRCRLRQFKPGHNKLKILPLKLTHNYLY